MFFFPAQNEKARSEVEQAFSHRLFNNYQDFGR